MKSVSFNIILKVPTSSAKDFAKALTGKDDDILLAAERAMRKRLGDELIEIELSFEDRSEQLIDVLLNSSQ